MATPIPRLPYNVRIVDVVYGYPTQEFQRWWLEVALNLEAQFTDIEDALAAISDLQDEMQLRIDEITALQTEMQDRIDEITVLQTDMAATIADLTATQADLAAAQADITDLVNDLAAAVADIAAAQADADAAQADADAAQADATAAAREAARLDSYPNPGSIVSADDVGSDVTITIDNHTRVYPVQGSIDVPDVSITGSTITGQPFSTRIFIYYDDTTLADTTPNFQATTSSATAQVGAAAGRHFVGYVDTPADGGASSSGSGGAPPGGGGGGGGGGYIP